MTYVFTIALDGPAAAGKGTVARALAAHYGMPHLDTGLLYRAVAYQCRNTGDIEACAIQTAKAMKLDWLVDEAVLRTAETGAMASKIAPIPEVRTALLGFQRDFAQQKGGAVLDGRDIGTVIAPDAKAKFFVTANSAVRAKRRFEELRAKGHDVTLPGITAELAERDERDAIRMQKADDAVLLDTTELSIDAAVAKAVAHIDHMMND